jgi:hypothetical protein
MVHKITQMCTHTIIIIILCSVQLPYSQLKYHVGLNEINVSILMLYIFFFSPFFYFSFTHSLYIALSMPITLLVFITKKEYLTQNNHIKNNRKRQP